MRIHRIRSIASSRHSYRLSQRKKHSRYIQSPSSFHRNKGEGTHHIDISTRFSPRRGFHSVECSFQRPRKNQVVKQTAESTGGSSDLQRTVNRRTREFAGEHEQSQFRLLKHRREIYVGKWKHSTLNWLHQQLKNLTVAAPTCKMLEIREALSVMIEELCFWNHDTLCLPDPLEARQIRADPDAFRE